MRWNWSALAVLAHRPWKAASNEPQTVRSVFLPRFFRNMMTPQSGFSTAINRHRKADFFEIGVIQGFLIRKYKKLINSVSCYTIMKSLINYIKRILILIDIWIKQRNWFRNTKNACLLKEFLDSWRYKALVQSKIKLGPLQCFKPFPFLRIFC